MGNNIILETKFVADISGSFYIPSYQRGYRWSEEVVFFRHFIGLLLGSRLPLTLFMVTLMKKEL